MPLITYCETNMTQKSERKKSFGTDELFTLGFTKGDIIFRFIQCRNMKFRRRNCQLNCILLKEQNQLDMNSIHLQQWEIIYRLLFLIHQKIVKCNQSISCCSVYPSVSILSSLEDNCLFSDNESRLGFVELAATSPSDDRFNPAVPEEDPKK